MKRYIMESPFAGIDQETRRANVEYAKRCAIDMLSKGESFCASHLLIAAHDILDDNDPTERAAGITAGLAWVEVSDGSICYIDRGISAGMLLGIEEAMKCKKSVYFRSLYAPKVTCDKFTVFLNTHQESEWVVCSGEHLSNDQFTGYWRLRTTT